MTTAIEPSPSSRAVPIVTGISHVGLTVRDIVGSETWYSEVLGLVRAFVEPHATGDGYAVVTTRPGTGLFVGLDHHPDANSQPFSPRRTGLDHLALQLAAGGTSTSGSPISMPSVSNTKSCSRPRSRSPTPWYWSATRTGSRSSCSGSEAEMGGELSRRF
ncbi:MAG TPA: hypothetical protein VFA11_19295 [Acidimicrobiales bacterium]|nr:hypothetical protein [Acidimicrobiales bacterium]